MKPSALRKARGHNSPVPVQACLPRSISHCAHEDGGHGLEGQAHLPLLNPDHADATSSPGLTQAEGPKAAPPYLGYPRGCWRLLPPGAGTANGHHSPHRDGMYHIDLVSFHPYHQIPPNSVLLIPLPSSQRERGLHHKHLTPLQSQGLFQWL